jgi:GNAT superfamily N-acetyltransferase
MGAQHAWLSQPEQARAPRDAPSWASSQCLRSFQTRGRSSSTPPHAFEQRMTIESIQDKAPGVGESKASPALPCVQEGDECVVKGMSCADCEIGPRPSGVERLRPILVKGLDPCGVTLLRNFVSRLRPDDVRLRFAGPRRLESDEEIAGAFQCDCPDSEMIWALAADGALAGIASYARVGTSRLELSLIVRSDLKRRGIGFRLLEEVKARAQQRQISVLCGLVLWENLPMRALARKSGFRATGTGGLLAEFELTLPVIGHTRWTESEDPIGTAALALCR